MPRQFRSLSYTVHRGFPFDLEPGHGHPVLGQGCDVGLGAVRGPSHDHQGPASPWKDQIWKFPNAADPKNNPVRGCKIEGHKSLDNATEF